MTDDTVALREELLNAIADSTGTGDEATGMHLWDVLDFDSENAARCTIMGAVDAILPIIARERAAALSAATPAIEARVRAACIAAVRGERLEDPQPGTSDEAYEQALTDAEAAIRKG